VDYILDRSIGGPVPVNFHQEMHFLPLFNNHTAKGGIDFDISRSSTIGVSVNWTSFQRDRVIDDNTYISNQYNQVDSLYYTKTRNIKRLDHTSYSLDYSKRFDSLGHKIDFNYTLLRYDNFDDRFSNNYYFGANGSTLRTPNQLRNNVPYDIRNNLFRIDYAYPFNDKARLEAGIKASWTDQSNILRYDSLKNGTYVNLENKNSYFEYDERVSAAYVSFTGRLGRYDFSTGVRAEQTTSTADFISAGQVADFNYLDWFPSLSLSRKFTAHRLEFNLNRRIGRPSYQSLDPTLIYFTQYYYLQGNIGLKPQYTNSVSLSDTYKGKYVVTLKYNRTSNPFADVQQIEPGSNVYIATVANVDVAHNASLSAGIPVTVAKWWNMYNNVLGFFDQTKAKNYMGSAYDTHLFGYSFSTNNTFTAPGNYKFELSFKYDSPQMFGLNKLHALYNLSVGGQKTFWKNKATVKLSIFDLLRSQVFIYDYYYANVNAREERQVNLRQLQFSFTYNFGGNAPKSRKSNADLNNERMKER
jgi:hypothetical protein